MKAHEFISRLDDARMGLSEEHDLPAPVAPKPSHAPVPSSGYVTAKQGKSDDEGEAIKKAIKQASHSIPEPVAPKPSHAPTSGKDYTTSGQGSSEDQGEKISKEAMKEAVRRLIDGDGSVEALLAEGHKAGCQCGFCKNKGKFGKKADGVGKPEQGQTPEKAMQEGRFRPPMRNRLGGERMRFRQPLRTPPKGCMRPKALGEPMINPNQPAMERLDAAGSFDAAIQEMADQLLPAPDLM